MEVRTVDDRIEQIQALGIPLKFKGISETEPYNAEFIRLFEHGAEYCEKPPSYSKLFRKKTKIGKALIKVFDLYYIKAPSSNCIKSETRYLLRYLTERDIEIYKFSWISRKYLNKNVNTHFDRV